MKESRLLIDGQWFQGKGSLFSSLNPFNGEQLWSGNEADTTQVAMAVQSARKALVDWSSLPVENRIGYLTAFAERLQQHQEALALCIAQETGKPLWESRTEVTAMVGKIAISIDAFHERTPSKTSETPAVRARLTHKPHGVLAVFGPYNFPGHLPNGHIVPALLAGNTVVFKPSEKTPATAAMMLQLWQQAGLPAGVLNLAQGGRSVGEHLVASAQLDGVLFTGSLATGRVLNQTLAADPGTLLALEMGGNNPLVVANIRDVKATVYSIILSAYQSAGQRCTCARRLLVPDNPLGDKVISALVETLPRLVIGAYDQQPVPFYGAVIDQHAANKVLEAEAQLLDKGAKALVKISVNNDYGTLLSPGLVEVSTIRGLTNVLDDDECFGPLLQISRYNHLPEAVEQANATRYGLSAGLLSDDEAEYAYFYRHIRAGIVNWNQPLTGASSKAPFGGVGNSGNHRPSAYYAADYCAYPVASLETDTLYLPETLVPGIQV